MSPARPRRILRALRRLRPYVRLVPGADRIGKRVVTLLDPGRRSAQRLVRDGNRELLQPSTSSSHNRYPDLFDALGERLSDVARPRILCFGCSTGQEVRALRERLPHARIVGVDINVWAIDHARKADPHPLSEYIVAGMPPDGSAFDAVTALAVLRHSRLESEKPDDCGDILSFARFDSAVGALDRSLMPGGWLAIAHSHFRLEDSSVGARYDLDEGVLADQPVRLLYGPDDVRVRGVRYDHLLWRKRADA